MGFEHECRGTHPRVSSPAGRRHSRRREDCTPAMGMPAIQGLSPDIDVDGDGLERFDVEWEGDTPGGCPEPPAESLWDPR